MGNLVSTTSTRATSFGIGSYVTEIPLELSYDKGLGSSRFLKTIRCKHEEGYVVVKIFVKPEANMQLHHYSKRLEVERDLLSGIPNILTYNLIFETDRAGYLMRQYMFTSLYDRISTRPFLSIGEKKWIAFQLLTALVEAHSRHVYHGDIKTENIVLTSWNWAYLSDFSSFKPAYLPEDNPADYAFYFDTSTRRSCYLAPERFYAEGDTLFQHQNSQVTSSMDIFSLGCTIAEIFLDGTSLFTLSQLLRFRIGEYDPSHLINRIDDGNVKNLINDMIHLDPNERSSAQDYLTKSRGTVFPEYFYTFLHFYCASLADPFAASESSQHHVFLSQTPKVAVAEGDYVIDRIYLDFEQISAALDIKIDMPPEVDQSPSLYQISVTGVDNPEATICFLPAFHDGCLILANLIYSSIRNCIYPIAKVRGIDLLMVFSRSMTDELKLDRILPFLCCLLSDESSLVRSNALLAISQILSTVKSISPVDSNLFSDYLMPLLKKSTVDSSIQVRTAYAQTLAVLAESASRFLELSQVFKDDEDADVDLERPMHSITYASSLHDLQELFQDDITALLIDSSSIVRRTLLRDISKLCIFFGRQKTNDVLLSHMITYLNDADWQLRSAFAEAIVSVGTFVGTRSLEEYILPLLVQALTDAEEQVVGTVLDSLASFVELGLIQKARLKDICIMVIPLMAHPNQWIRFATNGVIAASVRRLPLLDVHVSLFPVVTPFLKFDVPVLSEESLMNYSKPPVNRNLYHQTIVYASSRKTSVEPRSWDSGSPGDVDGSDLIERLKSLGMTDEDKEMLFMLKYHISKTTAAKSKLAALEQSKEFSAVITCRESGITPHTIFLTLPQAKLAPLSIRPQSSSSKRPRSSLEFRLRPKSDNRGILKADASIITQPNTPDPADERESSNRLSSSMTRRQSMQETIGNYDLTLENSPRTTGSDKNLNRWSTRARQSSTTPSRTGTAVDGQEKYIRRVLEKKIIELFPPLLPELGPKVGNPPRPVIPDTEARNMSNSRTKKGSNVSFPELSSWKPSGTLVAYFPEHEAQINRICVAQDHSYFATCSDDGAVKVWDCQRLHTNVANRSRLSYSGHGARVTTIACIENRHSIASASENGQIHISRVEYMRNSNTATKYTSYSPVTAITLQNDYAIALDHFETDSSSLLTYGTVRGKICALDLRSMKEAWSFHVPSHYGGLRSMTLDRTRSWILSGTNKGVLSLWDLRFQLCLKSWRHPSSASISKLDRYAKLSKNTQRLNHNKLICMAVETASNEISVWDIESGQCTDVFCTAGTLNNTRNNVDTSEEIRRLYPEGLSSLPSPNLNATMSLSQPFSMVSLSRQAGVTSFVMHPESRFLISGGHDRKLRFWDMKEPRCSYVFSGSDQDLNEPLYTSEQINGTSFHVEYTRFRRFGTSAMTQGSAGFSARDNERSLSPRLKIIERPSNASTSNSDRGKGGVLLQDHHVTKGHVDSITDVSFLQYPHPMVISGSRDGVVKVWQ